MIDNRPCDSLLKNEVKHIQGAVNSPARKNFAGALQKRKLFKRVFYTSGTAHTHAHTHTHTPAVRIHRANET